MVRVFQQAQEYIASLVYAHLCVPQTVMNLHLRLGLNLSLKAAGLLGLLLPLKLPAVIGWIRMLHILYRTLRISI